MSALSSQRKSKNEKKSRFFDFFSCYFGWNMLLSAEGSYSLDCIRKVGKIPILPTFCKKVGKVEVVGYLPTFEKKSR